MTVSATKASQATAAGLSPGWGISLCTGLVEVMQRDYCLIGLDCFKCLFAN